MSRRRRSGAPELVIISWRDIPAQVTASDGSARAMLPARFQRAIDRAAKVAGKTGHQEYIGEWHRQTRPLEGDAQDAVPDLVAQLDVEHDRTALETLVRQGGRRTLDAPPSEPVPDRASTPLRVVEDPGGSA